MNKFILGAAIFATFTSSAAAKTARCYFEYHGNVYIDGPCEFSIGKESFDQRRDGSFDLHKNGWWITILVVDKGWAEGLWNPGGSMGQENRLEPASHQHGHLGYLRREDDGACWSNREATVCAW